MTQSWSSSHCRRPSLEARDLTEQLILVDPEPQEAVGGTQGVVPPEKAAQVARGPQRDRHLQAIDDAQVACSQVAYAASDGGGPDCPHD